MSAVPNAAHGVRCDLRYRVAIIAASAGGLNALAAVLGRLPPDFPLPIVIVQHLDPHHASQMAAILGRRTCLRVKEAAHEDVLTAGSVPPNPSEVLGSGKLATTKITIRTRPTSTPSSSVERLC